MADSDDRMDVVKLLTEDIQAHRDYIQRLYRNAVVVVGSGLLIIVALGAWFLGDRYDESLLRTVVNNELRQEVDNLRVEQTALLREAILQAKDRAISIAQTEISSTAETSKDAAVAELDAFAREQLFDAVRRNIEPQLEQLQATTAEELAASVQFPSGMIAAFDRKEIDGACPTGWTIFLPAGGRTIVGAGASGNLAENGEFLTSYPSFADDPKRAVGGSEKHTLTIQQMPAHRHGLAMLSLGTGLDWRDGGTDTNIVYFDLPNPATTAGRKRVSYMDAANGTVSSGGNQPHNNMPPYVALYFCKKG